MSIKPQKIEVISYFLNGYFKPTNFFFFVIKKLFFTKFKLLLLNNLNKCSIFFTTLYHLLNNSLQIR